MAKLTGEVARIQEGRERVGGLMRELAREGGGERDVEGEGGEVKGEGGERKVVGRQRSAWAAIEQEVGDGSRPSVL